MVCFGLAALPRIPAVCANVKRARLAICGLAVSTSNIGFLRDKALVGGPKVTAYGDTEQQLARRRVDASMEAEQRRRAKRQSDKGESRRKTI